MHFGAWRNTNVRRGVFSSLAMLCWVVWPRAAAAQRPSKLPAVVIRADPGPPVLVGTVRDDTGELLEGVEVIIASVRRRVHTTADGRFGFDSIPPGKYDILVRKIGYKGQRADHLNVGRSGAAVDFMLPRAPRALPAIVSASAIGGLTGFVVDTSLHALPGAHVHVQGEGRYADTDSTGQFFFPLKPGSYFVAIMKNGFADKLASVTIPADSGRVLTAYLQPSGLPPLKWSFVDMSFRLAWRRFGSSRVYTHADMEKLGIEWIYDAVKMTGPLFGMREDPDPNCDVMIDGRSWVTLKTLTIDAIDSIEIYQGGRRCPRIFAWTR